MEQEVRPAGRDTGGANIIEVVRTMRPDLRKSDRKVADVVLADPRRILNATVAETAREAGAKVLGLIGCRSPLVGYCDVPILIETLDNPNVYTPTTSRIAALVVVDILSTSIALKRSTDHQKRVATMKQRLRRFRQGDE